MIGLSANDIASHDKWIKDIDEVSGQSVSFVSLHFSGSYDISVFRRVAHPPHFCTASPSSETRTERLPPPTACSVRFIC